MLSKLSDHPMTRLLRGLMCAVLLCSALNLKAGGSKADYERALSLKDRTQGKVFRDRVQPQWLPDGTSFWYRVKVAPGKEEFVLVNALDGSRKPGYEPKKAATTETRLSKEGPHRTIKNGEDTSVTFVNATKGPVELFWLDHEGTKKSYGKIKAGENRDMQTYAGHRLLVVDRDGVELGMAEAATTPLRVNIDGEPISAKPPEPKRPGRDVSPDGQWVAFIDKQNVSIRHRTTKEVVKLSTDGSTEDAFDADFHWSPDTNKLVVMQVKPAQEHKIHFVESSPKDRVEPILHERDYLKAGDRIRQPRPRLFDIANRKQIPVGDALFPNPWSIDSVHWNDDSSSFAFLYNERGHQVMRLVGVDAANGMARPLIEERSPTFIDHSQKTFLHDLPNTGEAIWMSERDGWNHLYLYDLKAGAVKNAITHGEWLVRRVEHVDHEKRQVWFFACGVKAGQDPYYEHLCRVNFDGSGFKVLTEGDGTHSVEFSPDRRWFVDTWSRIDQAPIVELRRSEDGGLVCALEKADATALTVAGWTTPERFTAKGRDGKTDIYGVIYKPSNFDPAKKYPVVEQIYAGPHGYFVPKAWGLEMTTHSIAELGFIVVQIDGMGTNWRSRSFHDVAWRNLKDAGLPDRIAWMKAAAGTRPWMDLTRVGVYGGSAGGQNALAALLHHGDFYKVAVADCGCHDNRMDKIWWNEAWLGWPVGPWYADNSNVTHASKLQGKLMLIVGEMDTNVDPASTMQVVNALVKADKDFELLIVPGSNHGAAEGPYASRRRMDFLVRNLLGVEPRALP